MHDKLDDFNITVFTKKNSVRKKSKTPSNTIDFRLKLRNNKTDDSSIIECMIYLHLYILCSVDILNIGLKAHKKVTLALTP